MVWGHMDPLENCLPEVYASHPWVYPLFSANCSWVAVWTPRDSGFLCSQQVNMPYVMIPAFPPSHQPLPVTPDSQLALPIQPIPCKPGECGRGGPTTCFEIREEGPLTLRHSQSINLQCGLLGLGLGSVQWKNTHLFLNVTERMKNSTLKTIKCFPDVSGCSQSRSSLPSSGTLLHRSINISNIN